MSHRYILTLGCCIIVLRAELTGSCVRAAFPGYRRPICADQLLAHDCMIGQGQRLCAHCLLSLQTRLHPAWYRPLSRRGTAAPHRKCCPWIYLHMRDQAWNFSPRGLICIGGRGWGWVGHHIRAHAVRTHMHACPKWTCRPYRRVSHNWPCRARARSLLLCMLMLGHGRHPCVEV